MVHIEKFLGAIGRTISRLLSSPPETPEFEAYLAELRRPLHERFPHETIVSVLKKSRGKGTDIASLAHRFDTLPTSAKLQGYLQNLINAGVVWRQDDMVGLVQKECPHNRILGSLLHHLHR